MQARNNSIAGNSGFDTKRGLLKESTFKLTQSLAEYDQWGPSEIEARQQALAKLAVDTWPIQVR
jgi:hypothetical protein